MSGILRSGIPSFAEVATHEEQRAYVDDRGRECGAYWLCVDPKGTFGPAPQLLRLRAAKDGEILLVTNNDREPATITDTDVTGKVLLSNGWAFWQILERCVWAERSLWAPCTALGIPASLIDATEGSVIQRALNALHDIGGAYAARRMLLGTHSEPPRKLTAPLLASMQQKALTDEQIEMLALDTWEHIALDLLASSKG